MFETVTKGCFIMGRDVDHFLLCTCEDTMHVDADSMAKACGAKKVSLCSSLCGKDQNILIKALEERSQATQTFDEHGPGHGPSLVIACAQQQAFFESKAEELHFTGDLRLLDIRDRAGWSDDGKAVAKQVALLAEAMLERPSTPSMEVSSDGVALVIGNADVALNAARRLSDELMVTCLVGEKLEDEPPPMNFDLALGHIAQARGSLGNFVVTVNGYAAARGGGRGSVQFEEPYDGAEANCSIIVDLNGSSPLFPAHEKRDGYFRADPNNPIACEQALFKAATAVGSFQKPLFIRFDDQICAHSRARQRGCNRCIDVCPTSAITSNGDAVSIDPNICAGCGFCAAVCPSGAASYDDPSVTFLFTRISTLARTFKKAGGKAPRLLVHNDNEAAQMIHLGARFGKGLPADVIPLDIHHIEGFGHAEILAALGCGFSQVFLLAQGKVERDVIESEVALAQAIVAGCDQDSTRIAILNVDDPDGLESAVYAPTMDALDITPIQPMGSRREVSRISALALLGSNRDESASPAIKLPDGAPYGRIVVDAQKCTLCLACVSLCPVGALTDNPDRPQVNLRETACLQCGICRSACPEKAINLEARLNLSSHAHESAVLHQEEPFHCVSCGKAFGVKSTIENIVSRLGEKHWLNSSNDTMSLIKMCDDCRVKAQYHSQTSPMHFGERPRMRTTDDELKARDNAQKLDNDHD